MKSFKKVNFHRKDVRKGQAIAEDMRQEENIRSGRDLDKRLVKQAHGHYYGKKWYPQG